jgi:hypothetical protein
MTSELVTIILKKLAITNYFSIILDKSALAKGFVLKNDENK